MGWCYRFFRRVGEPPALAGHLWPVAGAEEGVEEEVCRALLEVGQPGPAVDEHVAVGLVGELARAAAPAVGVQGPHAEARRGRDRAGGE